MAKHAISFGKVLGLRQEIPYVGSRRCKGQSVALCLETLRQKDCGKLDPWRALRVRAPKE